jgi:hypothetical protein
VNRLRLPERWAGMTRAGERIDDRDPIPDFEVQVRHERVSGSPHQGDHIAAAYRIAEADGGRAFTQMLVVGGVLTVEDQDRVAGIGSPLPSPIG